MTAENESADIRARALSVVYWCAIAATAIASIHLIQSVLHAVFVLPALLVLVVSGTRGAARLWHLSTPLSRCSGQAWAIGAAAAINAPLVLILVTRPSSQLLMGPLVVSWFLCSIVVFEHHLRRRGEVSGSLYGYTTPRTALFRVVCSAIVEAEDRKTVSGLASLGGLLGLAMLLAQLVFFTVAWVLVEVLLPTLRMLLVAPLVWCTHVRSFATLPRTVQLPLGVLVASAPGLTAAGLIAEIVP